MRISQVSMREIRVPLREPFRISSGLVAERRILLVELTDHDGVTAWSECVAGEAPYYSAETVDTAWFAIREWFAPRLLGRTLGDPHETAALLGRDVRGHRMALAALEMGVWVLRANRAGVALARMLGGTRERVDVGISLGIQPSPAMLVERATLAQSEGYRRIKLKIGPGHDIAWVAAVREGLGPDAAVMVDANNAYSLSDVDVLRKLDAFDLLMIEQPLEHEDLVSHAVLQRELRTPLCLDESITSPARAADMIALGSGRIINIKPGRVGGFGPSLQIHALAQEHGVPVWCGGMLESGIGRACNVALASLPGFSIAGDISPSARYWSRDIVTPEWAMDEHGSMRVPLHRPGLGVDVDVDYVDDITVRREDLAV
ncbi:MAG TPA: o-succinylbenzoate synthase [Longimicrobiales bacterium]|nr:o-succinylbenzoate synthase [Longimicrobiales bacterium]